MSLSSLWTWPMSSRSRHTDNICSKDYHLNNLFSARIKGTKWWTAIKRTTDGVLGPASWGVITLQRVPLNNSNKAGQYVCINKWCSKTMGGSKLIFISPVFWIQIGCSKQTENNCGQYLTSLCAGKTKACSYNRNGFALFNFLTISHEFDMV